MAALAAVALATPLLIASAVPAAADRGHGDPAKDARKLAKELVRESSAKDAYKHLRKLQEIADANGGHRAAGSPGHDASAAYVYKVLKKAGYKVAYDRFEFIYTETLAEKLSVVSPAPRDIAIESMTYTKSTPVGGVKAAVAHVPVDATTGCEATDYALPSPATALNGGPSGRSSVSGAFTGKIALIKRGGCTFAQKQATAADAGAIGAIVYNNVPGALAGTLGDPAAAKIPTGGITQAEGEKLAADVAAGEVTVNFEIRELQETRETNNVIAETRGGSSANTVMLGAHLDSVSAGPGINDNGSGSAGLLEVALELAEEHKQPRNKIRFALWSAEENGLIGSEKWVEKLTEAQKKELKLYLNFDMIASPNYGQFVYDGDDSDGKGAGPGPEGSAQLERDINAFLDKRGTPHEGTDFDGRSDYGPFIAVGIPSGGTFTGAEGVKTEAQAAKWGGTAGTAYDPCYHAKCDDLKNIDMKAFGINIGVIANAVGTYAHDLSSLTKPVTSAPTGGGDGSGGGLHADHDRVAE
ncbi:M28 family metallopeptidase [Streptomyces monticola]|uniref:M28 family metallopeptidase n=1 Tax=Streptomyces monticola TaxID=2666263 RepID=A0ABW2JJ14_9ACTN